MEMFGSVMGGSGEDSPEVTDEGYTVANAEDIDLFSQLLGGM